jgi:hypothetical protein
MDLVADVDLDCSAAVLFSIVEDLGRYPEWLDIVAKAEPLDEPEPSWAVDLRGRLGPLARSKRLRMVRAEHAAPTRVVFERAEVDGRQHSAWRLSADVDALGGDRSKLRMHLHYGGSLFGPVLERVLRDEIERSKGRLRDLVAAGR